MHAGVKGYARKQDLSPLNSMPPSPQRSSATAQYLLMDKVIELDMIVSFFGHQRFSLCYGVGLCLDEVVRTHGAPQGGDLIQRTAAHVGTAVDGGPPSRLGMGWRSCFSLRRRESVPCFAWGPPSLAGCNKADRTHR